jgi:hypothetical protein
MNLSNNIFDKIESSNIFLKNKLDIKTSNHIEYQYHTYNILNTPGQSNKLIIYPIYVSISNKLFTHLYRNLLFNLYSHIQNSIYTDI